MDSESMSRSSTKDFSVLTSSFETPATSSTISASPDTIVSLSATVVPFCWACSPCCVVVCLAVSDLTFRPRPRLRGYHHLARVRQAGAEADHEYHVAGTYAALCAHVVDSQRNGCRRCVTRVTDIVGNHHVATCPLGAQLLGDRLDNTQIRLVRHEYVDVTELQSRVDHRFLRDRC